MHWLEAQFGVYILLDSRDKSSNTFQHVSGLHFQNFHGFRVQILVQSSAISEFSWLFRIVYYKRALQKNEVVVLFVILN